ncbi:BMP family ABC transporter substrate-binding protein [Cellulomonas sp. DKR-3]|uniref:BMP family ABC transporter substrate-binding protein n=1 Tax=Cellulomonas fulva TaxID=2835530 RepID=A0ABS5TUF8_9CELL|nr:BMP family ABC transporter substrate-binding protein [Cellulomonas fulva]MBT0992770.1 BMP family ABC transporter substrate-binding protein [Cellulomonas fulva]
MKKLIQVAALSGAVALALAACGDAPDDTTSTPGGTETMAGSAEPTTATSDFKGCIVSDEGGFDDKSFNQLSYEGAKKAVTELGGQFAEVQSDAATEFAGNLQSLVSEGCDTIVSVGFALSADTVTSATDNADLHYILVDDAADNDFDGTKDAENIKPLLYDTAQAAFLAGYLSAGYSQAGKVGTFGGQPYPTVTIFMDGFKQGVEYYNKQKGASVQVVGFEGGDKGSFTGGFAANDDAKQVAAGIIDQGVDVILPVGGPIYQSAMDAIADSGRDVALIGADADVFNTDPKTQDIILTSILKNMDVSTYDAMLASGQGNWDPEAYIGTLENGGVGIAPLHNFEGKVDPALVAEVDQLKQDIIDGKVEVTSYLAQ